MESAIGAVLREARARGAVRVHRIVLRIGTLSGVEPEALRFAFDVAAADTLAATATLDIENVPARAHCSACHEEFGVESGFIFTCPRCGQLCGDIRQGRELELSHLEMS
jgi:hydrogenase nickel incorporation protein HypA/HybF